MKERIKAPKIELIDEEIANIRCRVHNTGIQDAHRNGHKMEEKVKAMLSEMKRNVQGTNKDETEARTQINSLELKKEINIQSEQNEETRVQKNEERLRNHQDNFKHSNI